MNFNKLTYLYFKYIWKLTASMLAELKQGYYTYGTINAFVFTKYSVLLHRIFVQPTNPYNYEKANCIIFFDDLFHHGACTTNSNHARNHA